MSLRLYETFNLNKIQHLFSIVQTKSMHNNFKSDSNTTLNYKSDRKSLASGHQSLEYIENWVKEADQMTAD